MTDEPEPTSPAPPPRHALAEVWLEEILFASRWLIAPLYLGLAASLFLLLAKFGQKAVALATHTMEGDSNEHAGYSSIGRLFAIGYLKGLRQAAYAD